MEGEAILFSNLYDYKGRKKKSLRFFHEIILGWNDAFLLLKAAIMAGLFKQFDEEDQESHGTERYFVSYASFIHFLFFI